MGGIKNNVSNILALVYLVPKISNNLLSIIDWKTKQSEYVAALKRIDKIFTLPTYISSNKKEVSNIQSIKLNNLSFLYDRNEIFSNVSLEIKKGQFYYVKGVSGCGKSTLLKILAMLLPIDDNMVLLNNENINQYNRCNYWKKISYLSQTPVVFPGTIRENIVLNESANTELLNLALKVSSLEKSTCNFSNGLETVIDDSKLSSGEKQKICLARAIYQQSELLLLDEAISAMDPESKKIVISEIIQYVKDNSIICLFVTHNTIADNIGINSIIVEQGNLYVFENN